MSNLVKKISKIQAIIALAIVLVIIGAVVFLANLSQVAAAEAGSNMVNATYCQQTGNGIQLIPWYVTGKSGLVTFTNGCNDIGHGMRNYTYTCMPKTQVYRNITSSLQTTYQYLVSWKPCNG